MSTADKFYFSGFSAVFIFLLWFLFCNIAKAQEVIVPEYLEGGVITLQTKSGETKALSKDWAIVKRKNLSKYKVCPVCSEKVRTLWKTKEVEKEVVKYVDRKTKRNSFFLNLGYGSTGLDKSDEDDKAIVIAPTYGPVFGATYIRRQDAISFGASVLTNQTGTILVGFDF